MVTCPFQRAKPLAECRASPKFSHMNPRALITGGAGFIGSHFAERLLKEAYSVCVLDDLSAGSLDNLTHLLEHPDFSFVQGDVKDPSIVGKLSRHTDYVFHFAAAVGVKRIIDNPIKSMATNIGGTEVMLEAAAKYDKAIVIASSSEVYGKSTKIPFSEDDDLTFGSTQHVRWSYAASKAIDEFLTLAYVRDVGLRAIVVRLFNTVGRRQTGRYGMVIPTLVRQALGGLPITVHGDGSQRRAFVHVSDVVNAIFRLSVTPEAYGEVFNIGNDVEISIRDLAEMIRRQANSDSEIITVPYEMAFEKAGFQDIARRLPDLTRIRSFTEQDPAWSVEEIVDDVISFFREHPDFS